MTTGLVIDERFINHDTRAGHPERPDRMRAIIARLKESGLREALTDFSFEPAGDAPITRVHDRKYLDRLITACKEGQPFIDAVDSAICPKSESIARLGVGGILAAVDAVVGEKVNNAFCAMRPPGHHAERDRSMGFCLYNNVAIAAEHLIHEHGYERIAIVDFDVHHGNGTQHSFEDRADVLFISLHQHPRTLYPGTGFEHETGSGAGVGKTLNVALMPESGDAVYQDAFDKKVLPAIDEYKPQFLLISAGFDAASADPLAQMDVSTAGFHWMTAALVAAAKTHCEDKCVSTLEGGYDLKALADGVETHIDALMTT